MIDYILEINYAKQYDPRLFNYSFKLIKIKLIKLNHSELIIIKIDK